ncbi:IS4 family transposase [Pseudanabaena sp. UWO311]|uniref:IS4 family transposase n=1 Tax=Pseudanabaena sp. UWO311 TaxID=2487337 RepID=UPI00115988F1|nr:IS4 family transposase [Pseudanabaena sp. UWO311]TYQ24024.1 IS4 family transposase [Pseudanabaena sp. UWO311]
MVECQSVNIRQISKNRAEQIANYRFLENDNVTISELTKSLSEQCQQNVGGKHVLAISDTSEINLQSHKGRLKEKGLGVVGNNKDVGFFIHPTLVLNAETGFPLGLSTVQVWTRALNHADKKARKYKQQPIEAKESYKWLASAERSIKCLDGGDASMVTHIGDREADLYEEWATVPKQLNHHLLIRACQNRCLWQKTELLYEYLAKQSIEGTYGLQVHSDARTGRKSREAFLAVRFTPIEIQRPASLPVADYPPHLRIYAVEVSEVQAPIDQEPILWRLLTTHEVLSIEKALQIIQWYCWRWRIEQLFATLKLAGLDIESTQLESPDAIKKLAVLALSVAVRTLQMVERRETPNISASLAFSDMQLQCLSNIEPTLQGNTVKQKNPHPRQSLSWATWIIARLGGWSGYRSQRPPGMPTIVHGLQRFEAIFLGWILPHSRLVCTR